MSAKLPFNYNPAAIAAQRKLNQHANDLADVFERLSSGLRINSASDDPAGVGQVATLESNRRVFNQGVRNLNDGISLLNVADGTLQELSNVVQRLKELAAQSANGAVSGSQRQALDTEAQALSKEYFRIARAAQFNGLDLFRSTFGELRLQDGYGATGGFQSNLGGAIGTGTFGSAVSYTTTISTTFGVVTSDLNGDGNLDMITAGYGTTGEVVIRLGTGGGSFGAAYSYAHDGPSASAVTVGDVNNDGIMDLVSVGSTGTGVASVRLGVGNGTFGSSTSYPAEGNGTFSVALGDMNGDGNLDLVTSGAFTGSQVTTVRMGAGNGTFGTAVSYVGGGGGGAFGLSLGDFNNDGKLDVLAMATGGPYLRLNNGDGTLGSNVALGNLGTNRGLAVGDFNGDGNLDLVHAGATGVNFVVRLGNGNGTFTVSHSHQLGGTFTTAAVGDLNGDGNLDLAFGLDNGPGYVATYIGRGDGTFDTPTSFLAESITTFGITLGDLNSDGVLDIMTAGSGAAGFTSTYTAQTTSGVAPLLNFSLKYMADARQALNQFNLALDRVNLQRATVGAFQSRAAVAVNTVTQRADLLGEAASKVRDADVAFEIANMVRLQILQQASSAVLAQANQSHQVALKLLQA